MALVTRKKAAQSPSAGSADAQLQRRIIKKYPNRRLYDTTSSAYITLAQVKELVIEGQPFAVLDAKTSEDLTRSIMLQIILEEESGGVPMFSEAALANMIRFYGHTMQGFMGSMLEKNMQSFTDFQNSLQSSAPSVLGGTLNGNFLEQSQMAMLQMQEQMLLAIGLKNKG